MNATIDTQKLSTFVKSLIVSLKLDGVTGEITEVFLPQSRVKVTFTHNGIGDQVFIELWFDFDQVIVKEMQ